MRLPVLVLDDTRAWLRNCLTYLPQTGYALEPTTSLHDALERLALIQHPVAVCDLRLIGLGDEAGFTLLIKAKVISEFTRVIIVTAFGGKATDDFAPKAMNLGAITYLLKPVDWAHLDECIVQAIRSWQQDVAGMANTGFLPDGPVQTYLRSLEQSAEQPRAIPQPDSSITRIHAADGRTIGAGFLVGNRQVLTCAHVVAEALSLHDDVSDLPQAHLRLDFPLVAPGEILTAHVICWQPATDVAGLELSTDPPRGSEPVGLVTAVDMWGHSFRAFGFPSGYDKGVWASGVLRGRQADGWLQIEDTNETGYLVAPGFSGGPVWNNVLNGAAGMIVAADTSERIRAAFLIPTDVLVKTWPDLAYNQRGSV